MPESFIAHDATRLARQERLAVPADTASFSVSSQGVYGRGLLLSCGGSWFSLVLSR